MRSGNGRILGCSAAILCFAVILPFVPCRSSLARQPQSAAALTREGAAHLEAGDLPSALQSFQDAARLQPSDPAIQFNIGLTLYRLGRYREALEPLGIARAHSPSAPRARFLRGTIFFQSGEFESCVREIEELRSDSGRAEEVLFMLVESNRRLGRANETQTAFVELNRRYPDSAFLHRLMGMAYDARSNYPKALQEFKAALRARPGMPEIAFAIGYIHWKQREYEDARAWLEKEIAREPCYALAHHYLAEMDRDELKGKEAAAGYRKAVDCDPELYDSWLGLGMLNEQEGRLEQAIEIYRRLVKIKPDESQPHFKLGTALMRAGKTEEAEAELSKARKLLAEKQERDRRNIQTPNPP